MGCVTSNISYAFVEVSAPAVPKWKRRLADGSVLEFAVAFSIQGFA